MSTNADDGQFNPLIPEGPPPGADYDPTTAGTGTRGLKDDDDTADDEDTAVDEDTADDEDEHDEE